MTAIYFIIGLLNLIGVEVCVISGIKAVIKKFHHPETDKVETTRAHKDETAPICKSASSTIVDEREKRVDRLLKKKHLTNEEKQEIYDFLVETGKEKWRYIEGYWGLYKINSYGRVVSCRYDRPMIPDKTDYGYWHLNFSVDRSFKGYLVHRLVAETFIPNPEKAKRVATKDGDYTNCDVRNLYWKQSKAKGA